MAKWRLMIVVVALVTAAGLPAGAGDVACCLCLQCQSGPPSCSLPPISCDVTCLQAGCGGGLFEGAQACGLVQPCGSAAPLVPAPTTSAAGLAAGLAALGAIAARSIARRRR